MGQHLRRSSNTILYLLALVVLSYTFWNEGRIGQHWVFVAVYVLTLLICLYYNLRLGALMMLSLIWLRINLAEGIGGRPLRFSSALFAILLLAFVLCVGERKHEPPQR